MTNRMKFLIFSLVFMAFVSCSSRKSEEKEYQIESDGKISEKTVGKPRTETVKRDSEMFEPVEFKDYLAMFVKCEKFGIKKERIDCSSVQEKRKAGELVYELERKYSRVFLPDSLDCDCEPREILWYPQMYFEHHGVIVAYLSKNCDMPKEVSGVRCLYGDGVIVTYTMDGKVIDCRVTGRSGDYFDVRYAGQEIRDTFQVTQACVIDDLGVGDEQDEPKNIKVTQTQYIIGADGKISQKCLNEKIIESRWKWNEEENQYQWE